jgi:hypothetical protein
MLPRVMVGTIASVMATTALVTMSAALLVLLLVVIRLSTSLLAGCFRWLVQVMLPGLLEGWSHHMCLLVQV